MTRLPLNISFESLPGAPVPVSDPAAASFRVSRDAAAGSQFNSPLSAGISPVAANPPPTGAAAGTHSTSGPALWGYEQPARSPRRYSTWRETIPPLPARSILYPAGAALERSVFAQALIDIFAVLFGLFCLGLWCLSVAGAVLFLLQLI